MSYYDKIINEFRQYVNTCNPKAMQSVYWFLKQANGEYSMAQAVTISEKDMITIRDLVDKFKTDCECKDKFLYAGLSPEIRGMIEHQKQKTKKK